MRRVAVLLLSMVLLLVSGIIHPATARADFYQCNYPNTCFYFDIVPGIGSIRGFVTNAPVEDHGQHWHFEIGGGGLSGNLNVGGNNIIGLGGNGAFGGIPIGISVTLASGTWRCPDERYESDPPGIIGTWNKDRPPPLPCHPVRVAPTAPGTPWPPETDVNIKVSWPPESTPPPIPPDLPGAPPYGTIQEQPPLPPVTGSDPLPNTRQGG